MDLLKEITQAVRESLTQTRARITEVRYGPMDGGLDRILFKLDGVPLIATLRGRNRELCLVGEPERDAGLALRTILDGHAERQS